MNFSLAMQHAWGQQNHIVVLRCSRHLPISPAFTSRAELADSLAIEALLCLQMVLAPYAFYAVVLAYAETAFCALQRVLTPAHGLIFGNPEIRNRFAMD